MPAAAAPPILHILAGPNGAGKTTLYETWVRRLTDAEFVNADRLCLQALGRHALTREDVELGQRLANERREALLAVGESLVTETTFSHPSKLDLITHARALGYRIVVYHVNVATADFAVARVIARESHGGHPVPEANAKQVSASPWPSNGRGARSSPDGQRVSTRWVASSVGTASVTR